MCSRGVRGGAQKEYKKGDTNGVSTDINGIRRKGDTNGVSDFGLGRHQWDVGSGT